VSDNPHVDEETRRDLDATVAARRELGAEHDDQLVAGFLERIEKEVDRRVDERLSDRRLAADEAEERHGMAFVVSLVSLGVSIPLLGIASGSTGMMLAVLAMVVAVNAIVWRR
jgi:hypothetical protein